MIDADLIQYYVTSQIIEAADTDHVDLLFNPKNLVERYPDEYLAEADAGQAPPQPMPMKMKKDKNRGGNGFGSNGDNSQGSFFGFGGSSDPNGNAFEDLPQTPGGKSGDGSASHRHGTPGGGAADEPGTIGRSITATSIGSDSTAGDRSQSVANLGVSSQTIGSTNVNGARTPGGGRTPGGQGSQSEQIQRYNSKASIKTTTSTDSYKTASGFQPSDRNSMPNPTLPTSKTAQLTKAYMQKVRLLGRPTYTFNERNGNGHGVMRFFRSKSGNRMFCRAFTKYVRVTQKFVAYTASLLAWNVVIELGLFLVLVFYHVYFLTNYLRSD